MTYISLLREYLLSCPDAILWMQGYGVYVHAIDDIIDNDIPKDKKRQQFILDTFEFAETIYSNPFYIAHINTLRPLVKMTSQTYMDSVQWEDSEEVWKRQVADGLRQMGNEIFLAVIEIVCGLQKKREASLKLREISYKAHHTPTGIPI